MGRKSNTAMPKLILLYEDIVRDGAEGCKRHKLVGKKYFGGLYEGSERNERPVAGSAAVHLRQL
ncbi:MAG: hypothetical protein V8R67_15125 [Eubacterium sp.]